MALVVGENSYASQAEADAYFADSLRAAQWNGYTTEQKDAGLIEVTRIMERGTYKGEKEVPTQALAFPRSGVTDCDGNAITPADTLVMAKEAQFEYAILVIATPALLSQRDATGSNTKRLKAGSAEIEYFRPTIGGRLPTTVQDILKCMLAGSTGNGISGSASSGTGDSSSFNANYDLNKGYY